MVTKRGSGGTVKYGYKTVATVGAWAYTPEPPHSAGPPGSGTIEISLSGVNRSWFAQEERFDLFLVDGKTTWVFKDATFISDQCFAVTDHPVRR